MSIEQLESAVAKLPPDELAKFRAWFTEFDGESWDRQIADDISSGKLDGLAQEALDAHAAGQSREL